MARADLSEPVSLLRAFAIALAAVAASGTPGAAQSATAGDRLPSFHVQAFELAGEPRTVKVGDPVRLTLRIRLEERVQALDRVTLPNLGGFDSYGDERHCVPAGRGSECTELLTVRGTSAGSYTLGPAVFEAVDAATGKPSRFESNAVSVTVEPRAVTYGSHVPFYAALALLAAALAAVLALVVRKGSRPAVGKVTRLEAEIVEEPAPETLPVTNREPLDDESRWRLIIANLAARPSRARVLIVRSALRERLGAREDETFGDLLARYAATCDAEMLDALRAVERAAFIDDAHLEGAVRDALGPLDRFARSSSQFRR
jgi:hypothetical protein